MTTTRSTTADYVTAFSTGWPEQPAGHHGAVADHASKGVQDFALNKEQALLIAKTIKETAARLQRNRAKALTSQTSGLQVRSI